MNKRVIICGPAASGKDFLKKKFKERGFDLDVSYTTRPIRDGEVEDESYHYISYEDFSTMIVESELYEFAQHGDYWYGTGIKEWNNCDVFIMETHGIGDITPEDRKNCFIIYLNPPEDIRKERLRKERGWNEETIEHRTKMDNDKFYNFYDYDLEINNPDF